MPTLDFASPPGVLMERLGRMVDHQKESIFELNDERVQRLARSAAALEKLV